MKEQHLNIPRANGLHTMDANENSASLLQKGRTMAHRPWQYDVTLGAPARPETTARPATRARRTGQRNQLRQAVLARHSLAA